MTVAVADQTCPTRATTADFFVNSMGELCRNGSDISDLGSINIKDLAERLGFDWSVVCMYRKGKDKHALARRWFAAIKAEWDSLYKGHLSRKEQHFRQKVEDIQTICPEGRFRAYGEIRNGKPRIVIVTEFIGFVDDDAYWTRFNRMVDDLKANVWIMSEDEHSDQVIHNYGTPQQKTITGKNHGRMERQVELSWRVEAKSIPEVQELIRKISKRTYRLWKESGVGVI